MAFMIILLIAVILLNVWIVNSLDDDVDDDKEDQEDQNENREDLR